MAGSRIILMTTLFVVGATIGNGAFFWMLLHALRRRRFEWLVVVFACPPVGLAQSPEVMDGNKVPIRLFLIGLVLAIAGMALMDF